MASLQTLRNKGGIIVAFIIGLALVAFVLGDFLSSGSTLFSASKNNVGEIDGVKIDYTEYSERLDYFTQIQQLSTGQSSNSEQDTENLRNQTWDNLIREHALKPALEKAGFIVTQDEMVQLISGNHISPIIMQMFSNQQTGQFEREYLNEFVKNVNGDQSRLMFWGYMQQEVEDHAQMMKYKSIIDKGAYVTSFEAERLAKLEGDNFAVRFVANKYSSISDSTITISESDAKKFFEEHKRMFKTPTSRNIEYVTFQALPSQDDYAAADKYITQLTDEFVNSDNVVQFVALNSQIPMDKRYYKEGELSGEMGEFAFKGSTNDIYGPELASDQYTVARIADVKMIPDSVNISHIALSPMQKSVADSLLTVLRKGGNFAEAAMKHSADTQTGQNGGEIGTVDPQTMPDEFSSQILKAKKDEIVLVATSQSVHLVKINAIKGENKKVQLATIKYTIEPSEATRTKAYSDASAFSTAATQDFDKAVTEKALAKRVATLGATDRELPGFPHSRELVRWAYAAKTGEVSKVMEFGDNNVIAVLKGATEEGPANFADVKNDINAYLINQKKGEMMAEKMKGATSVDDLASKLSLTVSEMTDVNWSTYVVPEVGMDPSFPGGVAGMDPSKVSKPVIGRGAVYVVEITGNSANPVDVSVEKARISAENQQRAFMSAYQAVMEMSKIRDLRYKFY